MVTLNLFADIPDSQPVFANFEKQQVLERLQALDSKARRKGLEGLDPTRNPLIALGMEMDEQGRVTKNGYGVFHLSWHAAQRPDCSDRVKSELNEIRKAIRDTHGAPLQFVIWAGVGGSAEDKAAYLECGLLKKGPKLYLLDSTDPAKLNAILEDIERRSGLGLRGALQRTLVVGMAMGMTSYETVLNLETISLLYEKRKVDSRPNFIYMTLPGSLLDRFAGPRGYRKVELQLDGGNTTAGRHGSPLSCGSLYPLSLAGMDLKGWIAGTFLTEEEIQDALRLAAFLHTQGVAGRDKVTLLLPKAWNGAEVWSKQDFEESLGKSEQVGLKLLVGERVKLANYRAPRDAGQQRVFLAVVRKGDTDEVAGKATLLRRAGYPVAVVTFPKDAPLSRYMQFVHYVVFSIAYLRGINFVTQPGVESYKAITSGVVAEAAKAGGIEQTSLWRETRCGVRQAKFPGGISFFYNQLAGEPAADAKTAPQIYASLLMRLAAERKVEYAELTFFGDTRYSAKGRAVRKVMENATRSLFLAWWKMPVDVYEGPAMNHSYHEMISGHGKCFSTVIISDRLERVAELENGALYHRAQFLAAQAALAERGRAVVAIVMRDLEEGCRKGLEAFFREALRYAKR